MIEPSPNILEINSKQSELKRVEAFLKDIIQYFGVLQEVQSVKQQAHNKIIVSIKLYRGGGVYCAR